MNSYFHKLAAGIEMPALHGVHCFVRTDPWTEIFTFDKTRIHYYAYDDVTTDAFIKFRIQIWSIIFDGLDTTDKDVYRKNKDV